MKIHNDLAATESPIPGQNMRVLLVEPDPALATALATELALEGFHVDSEPDAGRGLTNVRQQPPDLIVLSHQLPTIDGLEMCRRLRETSDVPIIMLTGEGDATIRVMGLNQGANDCLEAPFLLDELTARIRAQLRVAHPVRRTRLSYAHLLLDRSSHEVWLQERPIELTPTEFALLELLLTHPRQVLTRQQIMDSVWGYDYEGASNNVDVYVRYLRQKLEGHGEPRLIHTIRGIGYTLKKDIPETSLW